MIGLSFRPIREWEVLNGGGGGKRGEADSLSVCLSVRLYVPPCVDVSR